MTVKFHVHTLQTSYTAESHIASKNGVLRPLPWKYVFVLQNKLFNIVLHFWKRYCVTLRAPLTLIIQEYVLPSLKPSPRVLAIHCILFNFALHQTYSFEERFISLPRSSFFVLCTKPALMLLLLAQ